MTRTVEERFQEKIHVDGAGCWLWKRYTHKGYARFRAEEKTVDAHRWAYERYVGKVPKGLQLDHLCRVRRCVNPSHLEPVTSRENCLRGFGLSAQRARQTHCLRGHPLSGGNLSYAGVGRTHRRCLKCHALRERNRRARAVA